MTTTNITRPLTAKQEAFCLRLFKGENQREAYMAVYNPHTTLGSIDVAASELAHNPKCVVRLKELRDALESPDIGTVSERKRRLTEIYRANLTDFCDADGNIILKPSASLAEVTVEERIVDGETALSVRTKRLKLRDPVAAIQEQNKMERIGTTDAININNDNRIVNIIVKSEEGKRALEALKSGKLPQIK